jgi:hypothetical protein
MTRFRDLLVAHSNALIFRCAGGPGILFVDEPALSEPHKRSHPGRVDRPLWSVKVGLMSNSVAWRSLLVV